MRVMRMVVAIVVGFGILLVPGIGPRAAMAASVVVGEGTYACDQAGLAAAVDSAATSDPDAPGLVTFNCPSPSNVITFSSNIDIGTEGSTTTVAVMIDGSNAGGDQIVLDGGNTTNFFVVGDGGDLSLQHLTMQHGKAPRKGVLYQGGAIDVEGAGRLRVNGATFSNSSAEWGGAIYNHGEAIVSQSRFISNSADYGGAIFNVNDLTTSQSSFVDNEATGHGGAIDLHRGSAGIITSTFNGNTAPAGSTIYKHSSIDTQIAWSTIIQPAEAEGPALYAQGGIMLTGVILGGHGVHCTIVDSPAGITNSYSLSNDTSCGLHGEGSAEVEYLDGLTNLGLGSLQTTTVNGIEQSYYPVLGSPALNGGSVSCDTGLVEGTDPEPDQLGTPRPIGAACDVGAIEYVKFSTLCANQWNGSLRLSDSCDRSETLIELPTDGPITLCVNTWNGSAMLGDRCGRSDLTVTVAGDGLVDVCANTWNGALRVSTQCSRSERKDTL